MRSNAINDITESSITAYAVRIPQEKKHMNYYKDHFQRFCDAKLLMPRRAIGDAAGKSSSDPGRLGGRSGPIPLLRAGIAKAR